MNDETKEKLAAIEHEQWAHWTRHLLHELGIVSGRNVNQHPDISVDHVERLMRRLDAPYADLFDDEKDDARVWADKVIEVVTNSEGNVHISMGTISGPGAVGLVIGGKRGNQ